LQAQDQRHQSSVQIILGGDSPESSSYHALATNACQSHFLFPLSRNIDPTIHASSIHGCTPADTLSSRLVILKSICGLYTPCVSTACFKMKYVRQAHFRKCHSVWRVAPINHKRTMCVLLSQGGRVGKKKGSHASKRGAKLIRQSPHLAVPALVKLSLSRKVS
jgi:hypothetical protein